MARAVIIYSKLTYIYLYESNNSMIQWAHKQ